MTNFSDMSVTDGLDHLARAMAVADPRQLILNKIKRKLESQQAIIDVLEQEREFGSIKTFCGIPIEAACKILMEHTDDQ